MRYSEPQLERYKRQIMLPQLGLAGQERLSAARVLVVGLGGLGSPVCLYLAAAGVGEIGIVDADLVEMSNLQRQIAHHTKDLGRSKVSSAKEKMLAINPDIRVVGFAKRFDEESAAGLVRGYDFVVDCTDNFNSKFLINDTCVKERVAFSHAGILEFSGQTLSVIPAGSACYRCVFPQPPPGKLAESLAQAGVIGPIPGLVASFQAIETIKYLTGAGELLLNTLLTIDALSMNIRRVGVSPQADCPSCGGLS